MDKASIEALESLLADMTPGRWVVSEDYSIVTDDQPCHRSHVASCVEPDDARLISGAINALPDLLRIARAVFDAPRVELVESVPGEGWWINGADNNAQEAAVTGMVGSAVRILPDEATP